MQKLATTSTGLSSIVRAIEHETWVDVTGTRAARQSRERCQAHGRIERLTILNGACGGTATGMKAIRLVSSGDFPKCFPTAFKMKV